MLIQKPFFQIRSRNHTVFFFTVPFISVAGNNIVEKIPDELGYDDKTIK